MTRKRKGLAARLFRFAALSALVAWVINKKRSRSQSPEGIWRDIESSAGEESPDS